MTPRNSAFQRATASYERMSSRRHAFPDARHTEHVSFRVFTSRVAITCLREVRSPPASREFTLPARGTSRVVSPGDEVCRRLQRDAICERLFWFRATIARRCCLIGRSNFSSVTFQSLHVGNLSTADLCSVIKREFKVSQFVPLRAAKCRFTALPFFYNSRTIQRGLVRYCNVIILSRSWNLRAIKRNIFTYDWVISQLLQLVRS